MEQRFKEEGILEWLFHHNYGVFSLHQIAHVGASPSINLKLISREIIFEVGLFQLTYLNVTDRRTDGRKTYCGITALCVTSRGNDACL